MTGKLSERGNIEYLIKLGSVLNTILDPAKLSAKIEKLNGFKDKEDEEVVAEEGGEVEDEIVLDFSSPSVLLTVLNEEIESQKENVIFDFPFDTTRNKSVSVRIRNALSAMSLVGHFMQKYKYAFLGDHVGEQYANRFLKVKLETEIKAYYTQLNSPTTYVSNLSHVGMA